MNIARKKLRDKGYTIKEFCDLNLISLRTYRRCEDEGYSKHEWFNKKIDELESK